jgi:hypothetical protein
MIECTVCGEQNNDLAVTCRSCKGYLQTKIENLDLFSTMWGLLESPDRTFKRIVLSKRKNYIFLLSALVGVWFLFTVFWWLNLGARFDNTFTLLATGTLAGPLVGVVGVLIDAMLIMLLTKFLGGKATLRNLFAVVSYSSVPIVFALIFVFPIKIAIFGQYYFDQNPSPMVINSVLYVALLAFDAAAFLWTISLVTRGVGIAGGLPRAKSIVVGMIILLVVIGAGIGFTLWGH